MFMIGYLLTDISLVVSVHRKMDHDKSRKSSETENGKLEISESYILLYIIGIFWVGTIYHFTVIIDYYKNGYYVDTTTRH